MLQIVGSCEARLFGLSPSERLRRQLGSSKGRLVVADASAVLGDATVAWLLDNPSTMIVSSLGRPLAVAVDPADAEHAKAAIAGGKHSFRIADCSAMGEQFVRKLRRRNKLLARSLAEESPLRVERATFAAVYKGVTDLVTKWVWPEPAFWVTRLAARAGIVPNAVTCLGLILTFLAAWLFYRGDLAGGLAAAWAMTFLDTVDGKLARVTVTASALGNLLDHVTDYVHPPIWWICLAFGLASLEPGAHEIVWESCWIILVAYVFGRAIEEGFKRAIGFNQYLWRRFDSHFRLIVSRRNVVLLIVSLGLLLGEPVTAFYICAVWSALSVAIQAARLAQALVERRSGTVSSWLM